MSRVPVLVLLSSLLLLAACGQSGDLYLPDEESRARAAEIQPGLNPGQPPSGAPEPAADASDADDKSDNQK